MARNASIKQDVDHENGSWPITIAFLGPARWQGFWELDISVLHLIFVDIFTFFSTTRLDLVVEARLCTWLNILFQFTSHKFKIPFFCSVLDFSFPPKKKILSKHLALKQTNKPPWVADECLFKITLSTRDHKEAGSRLSNSLMSQWTSSPSMSETDSIQYRHCKLRLLLQTHNVSVLGGNYRLILEQIGAK